MTPRNECNEAKNYNTPFCETIEPISQGGGP